VWKPLHSTWQSIPAHIRKGLLRLYIVASSLWMVWVAGRIVIVVNSHPYSSVSLLFWTMLLVPLGSPILFFLAFWVFDGFRKPKMDFGNLRHRVAIKIMFRPDIAAYEYLATGSLFGNEHQRFRLDANSLSREQKIVLPTEFYTNGPDGVDPNELAKLFGYHSGEDMLDRLARLFEKWGYVDRNQMLNKVLDEELDRRKRKFESKK
jgi:hypothetical protein